MLAPRAMAASAVASTEKLQVRSHLALIWPLSEWGLADAVKLA